MVELMVDAAQPLLRSWESKAAAAPGGVAEVDVDDDIRSFSFDVISRACFGGDYSRVQVKLALFVTESLVLY
jgi:hypothetical protein